MSYKVKIMQVPPGWDKKDFDLVTELPYPPFIGLLISGFDHTAHEARGALVTFGNPLVVDKVHVFKNQHGDWISHLWLKEERL